MVTFKEAKEKIEKAYPESHVTCAMEIKSGYLFSIKPNDWDDNNILLDPFFKVDSNSGKISEYSPVMDPEEFKDSFNHVIYNE